MPWTAEKGRACLSSLPYEFLSPNHTWSCSPWFPKQGHFLSQDLGYLGIPLSFRPLDCETRVQGSELSHFLSYHPSERSPVSWVTRKWVTHLPVLSSPPNEGPLPMGPTTFSQQIHFGGLSKGNSEQKQDSTAASFPRKDSSWVTDSMAVFSWEPAVRKEGVPTQGIALRIIHVSLGDAFQVNSVPLCPELSLSKRPR